MPLFERGKCPLCKQNIIVGWEWTHLLLKCYYMPVQEAQASNLGQNISYLVKCLNERGTDMTCHDFKLDFQGVEGENSRLSMLDVVISIYLCGGLYRPWGIATEEGWTDMYQMGFRALKFIAPGFESYGYVYVAEFLQTVAPLFVFCLDRALYRDVASDIDAESLFGGSHDDVINQRYHKFNTGMVDLPEQSGDDC